MSFLTKMTVKNNIKLFWYSKTKKLPNDFIVEYNGEKENISNYTVLSKEEINKNQFDMLIFTYPHIYYKENIELLDIKNITKVIYFVYSAGSSLDIINDFKREYPSVSYILGKKSPFHSKIYENILKIKNELSFTCYCSSKDACEILDILKKNYNFHVDITNNELDIFLTYSNMIFHPSIWYYHYIKDNSFSKDKYMYEGLGFDMIIIYLQLILEIQYIKYKLKIIKPIKIIIILILIILLSVLVKRIFGKDIEKYKNYVLIFIIIIYLLRNCITNIIYTNMMPVVWGDEGLKKEHYKRDILYGCYYIKEYCKHKNIKLHYFENICNVFMKDQYFNSITPPVFNFEKLNL